MVKSVYSTKVGVCNPLNPTYNIFKEREVDNPFGEK
jgi:hypothetical protein